MQGGGQQISLPIAGIAPLPGVPSSLIAPANSVRWIWGAPVPMPRGAAGQGSAYVPAFPCGRFFPRPPFAAKTPSWARPGASLSALATAPRTFFAPATGLAVGSQPQRQGMEKPIDPRPRDLPVMPAPESPLAPPLDPFTGELLPIAEGQRRGAFKGGVAAPQEGPSAIRAAAGSRKALSKRGGLPGHVARRPQGKAPQGAGAKERRAFQAGRETAEGNGVEGWRKNIYSGKPHRSPETRKADARELRKLLRWLGMSNGDVARALGTDRTAVTRYVSGERALPVGLLDHLRRASGREGAIRRLVAFREETIAKDPLREKEHVIGRELQRLGYTSSEAYRRRRWLMREPDVDAVIQGLKMCRDRACAEVIVGGQRKPSREQITLFHFHRDDPLSTRLREAVKKFQKLDVRGRDIVGEISARIGIRPATLRNWMFGIVPLSGRKDAELIVAALERAKRVRDIHIPPEARRFNGAGNHGAKPRRRGRLNQRGQRVVELLLERYADLINRYGVVILRNAAILSEANRRDLNASVQEAVVVAVANKRLDPTYDLGPWLRATIRRIVGDMYGKTTGLSSYELAMARRVKQIAEQLHLDRPPTFEEIEARFPDTPKGQIEAYLAAYRRYSRALGDRSYEELSVRPKE